jgi:phage pi2 protein 07
MIVFASMDQPDLTRLELLETKSIPSGETVENTLLSPSKEDPINSLNVQNAGIIFFGVAVALRLLKMISNGRKHI